AAFAGVKENLRESILAEKAATRESEKIQQKLFTNTALIKMAAETGKLDIKENLVYVFGKPVGAQDSHGIHAFVVVDGETHQSAPIELNK
ncbi:MAG: hypothetical protein PHN89_03965, partial [Candidatus Pacebacteria bacterium]|nr:hypothetical protein [Candidatus Paceibacterota bacterium]